MSRNDLFLLLACAIVATVLSSSPSPLGHSSSVTFASLVSPPVTGMDGDPALFQPIFAQQ